MARQRCQDLDHGVLVIEQGNTLSQSPRDHVVEWILLVELFQQFPCT